MYYANVDRRPCVSSYFVGTLNVDTLKSEAKGVEASVIVVTYGRREVSTVEMDVRKEEVVLEYLLVSHVLLSCSHLRI
jgi:hypothetical protein